jgi:prophage regulatory protein
MRVKKESKTGINKVPYLPGVGQFWTPMVGQFSKPIYNLYGKGNTVTSTGSVTDSFCSDESSTPNVHVNQIGDYSYILSAIEQHVREGIRNFFSDPQNHHMLAACLALNDQKKLANSNMSRNISNNEILRPRDLPQVTGLGKTSIWRLEKAGVFVRKLKLSSGCVGYLRSDVQEWLANRQTIKGE